MSFLYPYVYLIAVSFLASLTIFFKRDSSFYYLKFFPPYLLMTLTTESIASYWSHIGRDNTLLYNLFSVFEFCFYIALIGMILDQKKLWRVIWATIVLYVAGALFNIFFVQKHILHTTTYAIGCLLVVAFCIYYFLELFRLPKAIKLVHTPAFWICSGLLFFYICSFPLFGFITMWGTIPIMVNNFADIINILNIFLYSLFTISFLCVKIRKYILLSS